MFLLLSTGDATAFPAPEGLCPSGYFPLHEENCARQILQQSRFASRRCGVKSTVMKSIALFSRQWLRSAFFGTALAFLAPESPAVNVVTIGDSLTAEYDVIPAIPGFNNLPTDYAKVTVPGWEAMSWVEVAGKLRGRYFNFGS